MTLSCVSDTRDLRNRPQSGRIGLKVDLEGLGRFFRQKHPSNTAAEVSALTRIPLRTAQSYLASTPSAPSAVHLLSIIAVYGTEVLLAIYPQAPAWLARVHRETKRADLLDQIEQAQRELAGLSDEGEGHA